MIPSLAEHEITAFAVYQRGLVIDSQPHVIDIIADPSISKGIGD